MSDSEDSFDNLSSGTMSDVMEVLASSSSSEEEDQADDPHISSDSSDTSSDTSSNLDSSENGAEIGSTDHNQDFDDDEPDPVDLGAQGQPGEVQNVPRRKRRYRWGRRHMLEDAELFTRAEYKAMYGMPKEILELLFDKIRHLLPQGN